MRNNTAQHNHKMKWLFYSCSLLLLILWSCSQENVILPEKSSQLSYIIPKGYPSDVLDDKALADRISFKLKQLQAVAASTTNFTT